ncbi:hypothetical protein CYMTET_44904 [Cymbomonas tetramitiformis]|uniref:SHSP domain-containing protein n=1 Tax=Cymbomonas tetramitiformis TaxID=36881 RepID=A0AAE0BZA2_9CHLO|nr:hypothetical protein CYMTET_44904 [Cymbomonas tetramitiformis]
MALSPWMAPNMRQMMRGGGGLLDDPFSALFEDQLWAPPRWADQMGMSSGLRSIPMDVIEKPDGFEVNADLPGVARDNIKVEVDDNNLLRITVNEQQETTEEGGPAGAKWHRTGRIRHYEGILLGASSDYICSNLPTYASRHAQGDPNM